MPVHQQKYVKIDVLPNCFVLVREEVDLVGGGSKIENKEKLESVYKETFLITV